MTELVQAFLASIAPERQATVKAVVQDRLAPALRASDGCRHVELLSSFGTDDGEAVETMLVVRWASREAMDAALGRDELATLLMELLLHVEGPPRVLTFAVDELDDVAPAVDVDEAGGTDRVDAVWAKVQSEIDVDALGDDFAEHPYVRWWFLSNGVVPDFLELARAAAPEITEEFVGRYERECTGALDDLPDGGVDPRSKTAQHLYYLTRILATFPDLAERRVLEIGGGFGNLARIVLQLGLCSGYHGVDIANVAELQRRYLAACLGPDADRQLRVHTVEDDADMDALREERFGLVVSTYALTETPTAMRGWYLDLIAERADAAYIVGQETWRGIKVADHLAAHFGDEFDVECARTPFESSNVGPSFELLVRRR